MVNLSPNNDGHRKKGLVDLQSHSDHNTYTKV